MNALTSWDWRFGIHGIQQFNVLMAARHQDGGKGLTQKELGTHLIVSPGSIARLTERLATEGLLKVVQNKNNRRENIVTITENGCRLIDRLWPEYDVLVQGIVNLVPMVDQKKLSQIFADWFSALRKKK